MLGTTAGTQASHVDLIGPPLIYHLLLILVEIDSSSRGKSLNVPSIQSGLSQGPKSFQFTDEHKKTGEEHIDDVRNVNIHYFLGWVKGRLLIAPFPV
jgi:hypothetical protein